MHGQNALAFPRRAFKRLDVPGFPDRRSEVLRHDAVFLAFPDSGHQQDSGPGAGAAQRQAFRGVGHSQPLGALGFERARALDRAMPVTIGFDDGTNGDGLADMHLHRVKIFSQCSERNFRPGTSVENQRAAVGQFRQIGTGSVHVADYSDGTRRQVTCQS